MLASMRDLLQAPTNAATAVGAALTLVTLHFHRRRLRTLMHVRSVRANIYHWTKDFVYSRYTRIFGELATNVFDDRFDFARMYVRSIANALDILPCDLRVAQGCRQFAFTKIHSSRLMYYTFPAYSRKRKI